MNTRPLPWLLAALLATGVATAAGVGDTLPEFALNDGAGKEHVLDDSVRRIYASADRAGDRLLKDALKEPGQAALDAQAAVVIADISGAPGFVKGMIRSSVRDRKYATWLDESGKTRNLLPYREDAIAVIDLAGRRITAVRYASSVEALRQELAPPPAGAP
jgi:hypothetical protein